MNTVITVVNKKTHASSVANGTSVLIAEPSVIELSVNNASDIAGLAQHGQALVITMRSGEVITLDDFYLLHKGGKNSLVIHDAQGLSTLAVDSAGQPVLDADSWVKIESVQPLLDSAPAQFSNWWIAGAGLLAGGVALAAGGGGGGGGRSSPAPAAAVVDHTPSTSAVISDISADRGVAGDFVTNDPSLMVSTTLLGTLVSGERVQISLDGGTTWHDAHLVAGSTYAYDNTANTLADGTYTFEARVVSAAGTAGVSSRQVVVIDTLPPAASETVSITQISNDTGLSATDFITSDNGLVFSGVLGAPLASGEQVEISLDGGSSWFVTEVLGSTWRYDNSAQLLAEGTYAVQARVVDAAGNVGQVASQSVQVDSTAVLALINITSISPDSGISSIDYITNGTKLTFFGTLSAPLGASDQVRLSLDGGVTWNQAIVTGTAWEYDPLLDGAYHVIAQVIDTAGNISSSSSIDILIDTSVPVLSPGSTMVANPDGRLSLSGAAGTAEPGTTVTVVFQDGSTGSGVVAVDGSYGPIISVLPQTSGSTAMTLTDIAGNTSTQSLLSYTDTTPPLAPATPTITPNPNGTVSVGGGAGAAEPGSTVHVTFPDGTGGSAVVSSNGSYGPITSTTVQTTGTVSVLATDGAGNSGLPTSTSYSDTTPPSAPSTPTVTPNPNGTVSVGGGAGAAEPGSTVYVTFPDGTGGSALVAVDGSYGPVISTTVQTTGTVSVLATDGAGNSSVPTSTNYSDITPPPVPGTPTVTPNPNGTVSVGGGAGAAEPGSTVLVTFPDGTGGSAVVALDGSYGPIISTTVQTTGTVSVLATDGAGNSSLPTSTSYSDTTPPSVPGTPTVTPNPNGTVSVGGGAGAAEPGSTVLVTFPDGTGGSAVVALDGSYGPIISTTVQTSGTVSVLVTDGAGNSSLPTSTLYTDSSAPSAPGTPTITPNPNGTVSVGGGAGAAEPGSTVYVTFPDGTGGSALVAVDGSYGPVISSTPQTSGTISVLATDGAGNSGAATSTSYLDTTPPSTPAVPVVTVNVNETLSISGGAGAGEPGSTLHVTFPDGSTGSALVAVDGSYGPIISSTPQTSGTVSVLATDGAGNSSSAATTTYADTTAPTATAAISAITPDSGADSNDFVTNNPLLTVSAQVTGTLGLDDKVQISVDGGGSWRDATLQGGSTYTLDNTSTALLSGTYTFEARVVDAAGNSSAVNSQSVTVDTQGPSVSTTITIDTITQDTGPIATDFQTQDNTLVFNGSLGAALAADESVQISLDGGMSWSAVSVAGLSWSFDHSAMALADQTYDVQARVIDGAGNVGQTSSKNLVIDTQGPAATTTITLNTISSDTGVSPNDFITRDHTLLFSGALSAALVGDEIVQISLDGGSTWLGASVSGTTWNYNNTASSMPDGTYSVHVRTIDVAGNIGQTSVHSLKIDNVAPSETSTFTGISDDSGLATDFITNDNTLIFSGQVSGLLTVDDVVQISLDGGSTWLQATVNGLNWTFDHSATVLADASYSVRVRVIDSAGNASAEAGRSVVVDTSTPSVSITPAFGNISSDLGTSSTDFITLDRTLFFNGTLSAPLSANESLQFSIDGGATWSNTNVSGTNWSFDNTSLSLANNTYTARLQVINTAGNVGETAQQTVVIYRAVPSATVSIAGISVDSGSSATDFVTSDQNLQFSLTLTGTLGSDTWVQVSLDGTTWYNATLSSGNTYVYDHTATTLAEGTYTLQARVSDVAGNSSAVVSQSLQIDASGPSTGNLVSITGYTDALAPNIGSFTELTPTNDPAPRLTGTVSGLNPNDVLQVYEGSTLLGLASVTLGTWSYQLAATADGTHSYQVVVVDNAGNAGTASSVFNLIVDTQAPSASETITFTSISVDSGISTDFITNDNTLSFSGQLGTPLSAGNTVQISVDAGSTWLTATVSGTTWSLDYTSTALPDGTYLVQAQVVDAAGNVGQTASRNVAVDTSAPVAGLTVSITGISLDTGASGSDFSTSDNSLLFLGNVGLPLGANQHVEISLDGGATWLTATTIGATQWQYDNTATVMADGTYDVRARVADTAGNIGQSTNRQVIIDSTAPVGNSIEISFVSPDSGSPSDYITNSGALSFSGIITAPLSVGGRVQILVGGGTWQDATVTGLNWTFDNTATPLADGTYTLQAQIIDVFGNVEQVAQEQIRIDTQGPSASATVAINTITLDTGTAGDFVTSDNALVFSGTLGAALGPNESVEVSLDNGLTWQSAAVFGTTWSYDNTANPLADATYTVRAQVIDNAGNLGQSTSQSLTIDTATPMASVAISGISSDTGNADFVTSDTTLVISTTLTGTLSGTDKVQISLDNGVTWNEAALVSGSTYAYDHTATPLAEGTYTFLSHVIDEAGNRSAQASQAVTIDTTGPTVGYTVSLDTYTDNVFGQLGDFATGTSTNDTTPILNGTVSGLTVGDTVRIFEGAVLLGVATVSGSTWNYPLGATSEGVHTYQAVISDAANNNGLASSTFTLTVDTLAPSASETIAITAITLDSAATDFNTSDNTLVFSGTLGTVLASGNRVEFSLDNGATYSSATVSGTTWSYDNSATPMADNTYGLKARVVDAAGNVGQTANQNLVVDTTAPAATQTITLTAINQDTGLSTTDFITNDKTLIFSGVLGAPLLAGESVQVRLNGGAWLNASSSSSTWSYDHTATTLADGAYTVDARVVDTAGNVGQSTSQLVNVDSVAPTATISFASISNDTGISTDFITSDNTLVFNGTLSAPLAAGEGVLFSLDNGATYSSATVSGSTWSYDNSANALTDGVYNLRVRVSDEAGNAINTANQQLTVDTSAPVVTIAITAITTDSAISTDFITSDTTLTFSGTLGSALALNERVEFSLDNGTTWLAASVAGSTWSYNNTANVMANGTYTINARVIDTANNVGQVATRSVQIDTLAPVASAAISAISTDAGISSSDFITNDQTLTIDALLTGTLNSGETVQISLDNGITWNNTVLVSGSTYRFDNTANTLIAGAYNFRARVVDTAGNATVSAATVVTLDTVGPAMTAVALTAISTDTASVQSIGTGSTTNLATNTDLVTRDPLLTVSGTYVGNVNAGEFVQVSTNGGSTWTNVTSFNNVTRTWTYTDPVVRTSATTYQLRAMDTAGNVGTGLSSTVVTVDTTAPVIAGLTAPVLIAAFDTGVLGDNITTTTTAITFTSANSGSGEAGATMLLINDMDLDGKYSEGVDTVLAMTTVAAGGGWSLSTAGQAVGSYHLGLLQVDAAGNRSAMTPTTQLGVVSADSTTIIANLVLSAREEVAVLLKNNGLWSFYATDPTNSQGRVQPYTLITSQQSLSTVSYGADLIEGKINSWGFADFQRSSHSGLITIGDGIDVLVMSSGLITSHVTLSGNDRSYGAVVAYDKVGDGYLDFAFGDRANTSLTFVTNTGGTLTWMNGTATTGTGRPTGTGAINNYAEVSAVDLDNNGTVDIAQHTNAAGPHGLTSFMNSQLSTDTFVLKSTAGIFIDPGFGIIETAMTWADFNNDGFMDLYLNKGVNAAQNNITFASRVYWNDHTGGFGVSSGTTGGTATYFSDTLNGFGSLAVDWNHDGKMDVIEVPANGVSSNVIWYANQGGGVFGAGVSLEVASNLFLGATLLDFNWDGAPDLFTTKTTGATDVSLNNNSVVDGTSLHLQIFDPQGINVFYANTVQLYNSAGTLVSSQIINPQSGLTTNDSSALVYFYGLSASETYTAVLLKSVAGVSSDVSGVATLGGNSIENVNTTWTGLTAGLATHNYVLSAEGGTNNASGNFVGTGYNDTFFATAGTDTYNGGPGWQTHYGAPAWDITKGEDILDFTLAGSTAVTVNLNTAGAQNTGFNTVTLTNIEGITGGAGNDNLTANTTAGVNSLLDGRGGNDTYTISGGGHTLLTFTNLNNADATGGNGSDTVNGFGLGNVTSTTTADVIDLSSLLHGYTGTDYVYRDATTSKYVLDKASEGLMNYLSVTNDGTNTQISLDRDGTGSTFTSTQVLTLNNVATDLETLLVNHQLIV